MKYSVMKKWVKALRSGKYSQTTGILSDGVGYCCLGVLCDVSKQGKFSDTIGNGDSQAFIYPGCRKREDTVLPPKIKKWAGMKSYTGRFTSVEENTEDLSELNDSGNSFEEIADIIEKNWKKL